MLNIAVIGAGQLGSRHLQALANVKELISIQVVDSSEESLKIAEARFNEVASNFKGKVSYFKEIKNLGNNIEIAIIATNSLARKNVIKELLSISTIKYLVLEKFLFTETVDFMEVGKLLEVKNIKTWVNCPRRMMNVYQSIKKDIQGPIHFIATGNSWGLGCNGIHLLDLFSYLTNSTDIKLSHNLIDKTIIESKRNGYVEFTGTITGYDDKNSFHITSFSKENSPLHIHINTPTVRYSVQEGAETTVWISRLENNWAWEELSFKMPFQSQLTNIIVDDILEKGKCDLTTYKESAELHLLFLNNLISFLQKVNNDNTINKCLIT